MGVKLSKLNNETIPTSRGQMQRKHTLWIKHTTTWYESSNDPTNPPILSIKHNGAAEWRSARGSYRLCVSENLGSLAGNLGDLQEWMIIAGVEKVPISTPPKNLEWVLNCVEEPRTGKNLEKDLLVVRMWKRAREIFQKGVKRKQTGKKRTYQ